MAQSLLIKLAMLAAAVALVFWIGWPMPKDQGLEDEGEREAPARSTTQPQPGSNAKVSRSTLQAGERSVRRAGKAGEPGGLDLNGATVEELEALPGIGPVLAQRIVEWRRGHGAFQSVDDLNRVKGIGEKKLRQLRPAVTVRPPHPRDGVSAAPPSTPSVKGPGPR